MLHKEGAFLYVTDPSEQGGNCPPPSQIFAAIKPKPVTVNDPPFQLSTTLPPSDFQTILRPCVNKQRSIKNCNCITAI